MSPGQPWLAALGDPERLRLVRSVPVGGGDTSSCFRAELSDGRRVFVKLGAALEPRACACEAFGLRWLAETRAIRTPAILACSGEQAHEGFLVLEWIESAAPAADFAERLGRSLAAVHGRHAECFGLDHDNFVGPLPQDNRSAPTFARFWIERRLMPRLAAAVERGRLDPRVARRLERAWARIEDLLAGDDPPCRLHGDLWSGNVLVDERGLPTLVDPSAYAAHPEVDLAMMRLFGGFPERTYDAYREARPLAPGWERREPVLRLYPLLVHVELFGGAYATAVERIVAGLA